MFTLILSIATIVLLVFLSLAVVFRKYKHTPNVTFALSLISSAAVIFADAMCLYKPETVHFWKIVGFWSEAVMAPAWLLFALSFARQDYWRVTGKFSKLLVILSPMLLVFLLAVPFDDLFYSPEFEIERVFFLDNSGVIFNVLLLLYAIIALVNLEATLRSSNAADRWHIKYTLVGVSAILAMNIFYYSHALLYRSINMNLFAVKSGIILLSALLIGFSLHRHKVMTVQLNVSRKILHRSLSVFIVGFYLLGLGIIGQGMRYFGPQLGKNITTFLGFAGAIGILSIILSEQLRRKSAVFINKHFYRHKYDYREQWLKFSERISLKHTLNELLSSIAEGFKDAVGAKGAAIWLKTKEKGEYSCFMTDDDAVLLLQPNNDMLEFLKKNQWIINVKDDKCKEVVGNNTSFLEKTKASLVVPLTQLTELTGFIVLREELADNEYNFEDYDLLKTLAKQASSAILNARLSEELAESKEMEVVGRISSFIVHDLKNAASMLSLTAQNAEEHIDDPDFQRDAIRTISNSSDRIKKIIHKLKDLPGNPSIDLHYHDLAVCVKNAMKEININGNREISFQETDGVRTRFDKNEIRKVIINLILNALEATETGGQVTITTGRENNTAYVRVSDNGCGMSHEFIEKRLFRPFQTTKKKGLGIGLYQCKAIIEAHSGTFKISSQEGKGTVITVYLPFVD